MKVSIARIKLVLKTGKTLSDGTNPIMLSVAFNGKKMVSTGYSCAPKYWDKANESVKRGYPNFTMINTYIHSFKNEVIERRNEFERLGTPYTVDMLLTKREVLDGSSLKCKDLWLQCVEEKGLRPNTSKNWKMVFNELDSYKPNIIITEITTAFIKKYADHLKRDKGLKDSSIKEAMNKIGALQRWCISKGMMKEDDYCFDGWSFRGNFSSDRNLEFIHPRSLPFLKEYFLSLVVDINGTRWSYKEDIWNELTVRHTSLFAIYYYCIGLTMCGISPIDLALLKREDFKVIVDKGVPYWSINYSREKTGKVGRIRIKKKGIWNLVIINTLLMFGKGMYFMPILDERYADIDKMKMAVSGNLQVVNKKLKEHWKKINQMIINHNVNEHDNVPLIDENISMYSYRHSFAMHYVMNGGNPLALATMLGHSNSMKAMSSYIALLRRDSDLIDNYIEI